MKKSPSKPGIAEQAKESAHWRRWLPGRASLPFWLLLGCGLVLRVLFLGRAGYHKDEAAFVWDSVFPSGYGAVIHNEFGRFYYYQHLVLVKLIIRAVVKLIGFAGQFPPEWLPRLPFALLGTATLPLLYRLGKADRGRSGGLWAMLLITLSIYHVFNTRDAYDYGLLMFFAAGSVTAGVLLMRAWFDEARFSWPRALGYMFFSEGLLQAHLCGLLFLAAWNAVMAAGLLTERESRRRLFGKSFWCWAVTFGTAYLLFSPFIVVLLNKGLQYGLAKTQTRSALFSLWYILGPMGWGESLWAVIPFIFFVVAGVADGIWQRRGSARRMNVLLALLGVLYFSIQSYTIRYNRFEVRYFASLLPLLMYFAANGIRASIDWIARFAKPAWAIRLHLVGAMLLLAWLAPSLSWVVRLHNNLIWNYKPVAEWVNRNLPENGVFCVSADCHMSMFPSVYPTPGRFPTAISEEKTQQRVSFFTRFPLACSVELVPQCILYPAPGEKDYLPRTRLFKRSLWITDPYWEKLIKLGTNPLGARFDRYKFASHVLISYNKPEDLPLLAAERGESFYSYFGTEWQYARDQQMNDWKTISREGTVFVGNILPNATTASVSVTAVAFPANGWLTISSETAPSGNRIPLPGMKVSQVSVTNLVLNPGVNALRFRFTSSRPDGQERLLVYEVSAKKKDE